MTSTDLVHSAYQIAYERPSAAENALVRALPLRTAETGPVNLTWDRPRSDLWPYA